jgi:hypothetical protein
LEWNIDRHHGATTTTVLDPPGAADGARSSSSRIYAMLREWVKKQAAKAGCTCGKKDAEANRVVLRVFSHPFFIKRN